jgi:hypothetical protein
MTLTITKELTLTRKYECSKLDDQCIIKILGGNQQVAPEDTNHHELSFRLQSNRLLFIATSDIVITELESGFYKENFMSTRCGNFSAY